MRLVSGVDDNMINLLDHSWLYSVLTLHSTHTANPVHVMKSPLLAEEFIHGSNVRPYQIFGNTPDRASLIPVTMMER